MAVKIGKGHTLELAKENLPHVDYDPLPYKGHKIGLAVVEYPAKEEHHHDAHGYEV